MTAPQTRRRIAIACVFAALAGQVVLPFLHTIVHQLEAAADRARAKRWRVEPSRIAKSHERVHEHTHDGEPPHEHPPGEHHHHHPGDERGGHGLNAPEHLNAIVLPTAPVVVPPSYQRVARVALDLEVASIALAAIPSRDHNRGPPFVA